MIDLDILVRVLDAVEVLSNLSKDEIFMAIHTRPDIEPQIGWHDFILMGFLKEKGWAVEEYLTAIYEIFNCLEFPIRFEPYLADRGCGCCVLIKEHEII